MRAKEDNPYFFNCLQVVKFINILKKYDIKIEVSRFVESEEAFTDMFKEMVNQLSEQNKNVLFKCERIERDTHLSQRKI